MNENKEIKKEHSSYYFLEKSKIFHSHSCYTLPKTSSYSSLSTSLPRSASSASISSQVKLKLKNCILQKLRDSNSNVESTPVLHPQPIRSYETKNRSSSQTRPIRANSEPFLKEKSAFKWRLIEKRKMFDKTKCVKLNNPYESHDQTKLTAAILAATAALTQQPQNILQQIAFIQQQLMRTERAQLSVPNLNFYQNKSQPVNDEKRSQFGHLVHVEEENELLLENELKHVAKQNENELNKAIYNEQPLPRANSYQFEHRHKKYFKYMQQKEQSKQTENRCFSHPNLFAYNSNTHQNNKAINDPENKTSVNLSAKEENKDYEYTNWTVNDRIELNS
ncbi:hypothetical protein BpHYR1_048756 [Brachionus plicatilis]|uniref:Uncharacterized protein n=1 Tax=Brachionus plicatilis TaxID=10195 RepID=A0A3M7QC23_BRAPC|nr:hypothetical protein BpHYR1_048756 [Brachionus plicatilis]